MNIESGIQTLASHGLNIFLSAKVSSIPESIYTFTEEQKKKTLCLIGHGGKKLWENIPDKNAPNPIDHFSISQMKWFSENVLKNEIEILFPNDNFLLPLQQLGRFLNFSTQSPLGLDISNEFGLWFAYRGVFLVADENFLLLNASHKEFPCESCSTKPCLSVSDVNDARLKCPVKNEHQYTLPQRDYHQSVLSKLKRF